MGGANQHRHPANKCTRSISHAHPNGKRTHSHKYSCKGNGISRVDNDMLRKAQQKLSAYGMRHGANQHRHPANKCTRSISHAHPNGKRKHSHKYSCKGNGMRKSNGNGHVHPANSRTRSIKHYHPNGARKHSHHYGS